MPDSVAWTKAKKNSWQRADYRRRVVSGQCVFCKQKATAGTFCFDHWLKNIGNPYKLTKRNGGIEILKSIWETQNGRCAVLGVPLIPGVNASLDHIVPLSKGGTSTKENLRWVLLEINRAKGELTHQQFVEMCRSVVLASSPLPTETEITYDSEMRSN